ncbi:UDP-N-acetylmuramoyl-tripeptide--D-alanyl-D-alanine ligase [candidate division KSB1 bacterium]|nr:UDP-N-acetylmuramoyl-tripeptide--D-alanyl-D-alanine ligase [candidate division KSB1 bacterium]
MKLTIADILAIPVLRANFIGSSAELDIEFNKVSIDSRNIAPGDLFIAIRGERFDAHQFVDDVLAKGALAAVVSQRWISNNKTRGNLISVPDTLTALQEISRFYRHKFSLPLIAITGSNGKTTTKEMVASVLSQQFRVLKNPGNLNNHIGVPLTLLMLADTYDLAVIEFGTSRFGEIKRLTEISAPGYGLITNIGPAHLEFFGSLEGVAREKTDLWRYIESTRGTAFVNTDDPFLADAAPGQGEVITYGFNRDADFKGELIGLNHNGCAEFTCNDVQFSLSVPGEHNMYNALATIAVASRFGIELPVVRSELLSFHSTSKRMELIQKHGLTLLNDCYNSNLASAEKALQTLAQIQTKGMRFAIMADMLELGKLGEAHHRAVGRLAADLNIDYLLAYGPLSRFTFEEAKLKHIKNALHFDDKKQLIQKLKELIHPDDIILIKGSRGMAMEEVTSALLTTGTN